MPHRFFQFADPLFFLLLLAIPLIIAFLRKQQNPSIHYSHTAFFNKLPVTWKQRWCFLPWAFKIIGLILLVIALARPQMGNQTTEILSEGIDIMLAIDTSGSMKALDLELDGKEANRLDVVKTVVRDFINKRPYDRIGMVIFGDEAYTQSPLALDKESISMFLDWIRIGIVGDGTAIGNGLAMCIKRLSGQPTKSKIVILLTDGRNNAGAISPTLAANLAKEYGIKVYTIGVGSHQPVPFPEETPFGMRRVMAHLEIDEETLKLIASTSGGQYFSATDTEGLKNIYDTIDTLEKTEIKMKEYREYEELYPLLALAALVLLILSILLEETLFMRIP